MRVNVTGGNVNVTIYTPPTSAQQKWMKENDISTQEMDVRRDSFQVPKQDTSEITNQLVEHGNELDNLSYKIKEIINSLVVTRINPKFSPATVGTESYYITENPENLNEDLFEKLKDIKSQLDNLSDLSNDLKRLSEE
jgi:hypothetical protein